MQFDLIFEDEKLVVMQGKQFCEEKKRQEKSKVFMLI